MTNVLIPTDFTASSLKMAESALRNENLEKCNIILFHAFAMPESPFDLLAATAKDPACELMNEPFRQACKQLKDQYSSRVSKIIVRCMTGDSKAVFRNFAEANDIDLIYCPENYVFKQIHHRSVNPCYLFEKCGIPVMKAQQKSKQVTYVTQALDTMQLSTS